MASEPVKRETQGGDALTTAEMDTLVSVQSDKEFNIKDLEEFDCYSMEALRNRDNSYSKILDCYYQYTGKILKSNPKRQKWFFWVSLFILIASPIQLCVFLWIFRNSDNFIAIAASAVEAVGALMVFPKIIAEYLFNTDEITSINHVVSSIQQYDISLREGIRHTAENKSGEL